MNFFHIDLLPGAAERDAKRAQFLAGNLEGRLSLVVQQVRKNIQTLLDMDRRNLLEATGTAVDVNHEVSDVVIAAALVSVAEALGPEGARLSYYLRNPSLLSRARKANIERMRKQLDQHEAAQQAEEL